MSQYAALYDRLLESRAWPAPASWLLVVLFLVAPAAASIASEPVAGVATVIDGDTIDIHGTRIRLHGIDAPESAQLCQRPDGVRWRCGQQAALALQDHLGRRTVTCVQRDTDRYGRRVAQCSVGGTDLNAWLVANG